MSPEKYVVHSFTVSENPEKKNKVNNNMEWMSFIDNPKKRCCQLHHVLIIRYSFACTTNHITKP